MMFGEEKNLRPRAIPTIFKHKVYDVLNLDGTTVSFKSSASQKRRSTLERTEANCIFTSFYCFFWLARISISYERSTVKRFNKEHVHKVFSIFNQLKKYQCFFFLTKRSFL